MPARSPLSRSAVLLLFAALGLACSGGQDGGRPIESLELIDFSVAGMFKQLSAQLGRPYVLELPPNGDGEQQDLRLENTDERGVLEELCRLDPRFQYVMDGPAWMLFPSGALEQASPFSKRVERFRADGGVQAVLKQLMALGLSRDTVLVMPRAGQARPVKMDVAGATVRELLAEIAAQGHLAFVVEPGYIRVSSLPD